MGRRSNLKGGDALTWALLLGLGGFAAFKVVQEVQERGAPTNPPTSSTPPTSAAPAGPVVTTPGGTIVQPGAPLIVGGAQPSGPVTAPVSPTLPVLVVSSSIGAATLRATGAAQLRFSGAGVMSTPEGVTMQAGETRTFDLSSGAVLECQNSAGAWVAVASSASPNTAPPVVVGAPHAGALWAVMPRYLDLKGRFTGPMPITQPVERPVYW